MKIKDFINETFGYKPKDVYLFTLPTNSDSPDSTTVQNSKETTKEIKSVFPSIDVNLDYLKTKYNLLINSDIIVREFNLNARGKQYKALLLYIDGMVDSQILNNFVLEPLMLRNRNNLFDGKQNHIISEAVTNNITVRKIKKFNLSDYIENCLIPQNSIKQQSSFSDIFAGVNAGNCALFVDTLSVAFDIDVKGFKQRSISKPENEIVIKGPHEAFVENLRTNTSLLRRLINNENLVIENTKVGKITQTNCAVCYMKTLANDDLIAEVKYRINNLEIDSLLSAGELEQLLTDTNNLGLPKILVSERPDNAVNALLQGRVIVIVNGSSSSNVYNFSSLLISTRFSFGNVFNTCDTCIISSLIPVFVAADILNISNPFSFANFSKFLYRLSSCILSILFATIICFLSLNF